MKPASLSISPALAALESLLPATLSEAFTATFAAPELSWSATIALISSMPLLAVSIPLTASTYSLISSAEFPLSIAILTILSTASLPLRSLFRQLIRSRSAFTAVSTSLVALNKDFKSFSQLLLFYMSFTPSGCTLFFILPLTEVLLSQT